MGPHAIWRALLLAIGMAACSAAIDLESLDNGECDEGFKACDDMCVPTDNPLFGCAAPTCSPCVIPNAAARCSSAGECTIAVCDPDFDDCTPENEPDCDIDLAHDPLHCSECDNVCELANAQPLCANRRCVVGVCDEGWGDCDEMDGNGCEVDLTQTVDHCGDCDTPCDAGAACMAGECVS